MVELITAVVSDEFDVYDKKSIDVTPSCLAFMASKQRTSQHEQVKDLKALIQA